MPDLQANPLQQLAQLAAQILWLDARRRLGPEGARRRLVRLRDLQALAGRDVENLRLLVAALTPAARRN